MNKVNESVTPTALITGGSRGIGRACALELANRGYHVGINFAGNEAAASETIELLREINPEGIFHKFKGDVSDEAVVKDVVSEFLHLYGRIDVLINCAGITRDGLLVGMKPEAFDDVIRVNLRGTYLICKEVFRPMMKQRQGRVVNLSSVCGVHGNAGQTNYAASKAGVIGFTKSLAKEGAARGILANVVAPGFVETDMTAALPEATRDAMKEAIPLKRGARAEEIARAVAFLASEDNTYITGQILEVDGGMFL